MLHSVVQHRPTEPGNDAHEDHDESRSAVKFVIQSSRPEPELAAGTNITSRQPRNSSSLEHCHVCCSRSRFHETRFFVSVAVARIRGRLCFVEILSHSLVPVAYECGGDSRHEQPAFQRRRNAVCPTPCAATRVMCSNAR